MTLPGRSIGRGGPISDTTPLEIVLCVCVFVCVCVCVCVCVEDYVCRTSVNDITTLRARKIEAGRNLAKGMLTRTWAEVDCLLDVVGITTGFSVEMLKSIHKTS